MSYLPYNDIISKPRNTAFKTTKSKRYASKYNCLPLRLTTNKSQNNHKSNYVVCNNQEFSNGIYTDLSNSNITKLCKV